jgi:hypothetical protein
MAIFLDRVLRTVNEKLHIQKLSVSTYLILVFMALFGLTLTLLIIALIKRSHVAHTEKLFTKMLYFMKFVASYGL